MHAHACVEFPNRAASMAYSGSTWTVIPAIGSCEPESAHAARQYAVAGRQDDSLEIG